MTDSGQRATPRQARSEQTVGAILDAADAIFAEISVEEATTTQIAQAAGVSVGALYRFYDDKSAIASALVDRYAAQLAGLIVEVEAILERDGVGGVREGIARIVTSLGELCHDHPGYFAVMRHLRDNRMREVQLELLATWFEISPKGLSLADRRQLAVFVSEVTRALIERAPASGKARQKHLDEIVELLVPYLEARL